MRTKSFFATAVCAVALAGIGAGGALAGEVKGPPASGGADTAAPTHANSICAFSGLNDFRNGQNDTITQTPKDGPPGTPGEACRGGSN